MRKSPSLHCKPHPVPFVPFFPFVSGLTPFYGDRLPFSEAYGLLAAFNRCSVGVVPCVNVFFYFCGKEDDLHVLLLHHLEYASRYSVPFLILALVISSINFSLLHLL